MLIGEFQHTVDTKGRVAVPAKFRVHLTKGAVITRGLEHCLFLINTQEWEALATKLAALPLSQANSRAFARLMFAGAMDVDIDGQGRILIPDYLRTYAGIGKDVVVAGLYTRIEIWDTAAWNAYRGKTEKNSDEIAEKLSDMGMI
ncbi:MAG: division/cell wall cluster transcriptional repressor MraZ [Candidatus Liptonbacteria bacterium]|nr:division/cell wall cluster transcriptional repressor MraZ [Candidatus Liptonbacteria bacterium]